MSRNRRPIPGGHGFGSLRDDDEEEVSNDGSDSDDEIMNNRLISKQSKNNSNKSNKRDNNQDESDQNNSEDDYDSEGSEDEDDDDNDDYDDEDNDDDDDDDDDEGIYETKKPPASKSNGSNAVAAEFMPMYLRLQQQQQARLEGSEVDRKGNNREADKRGQGRESKLAKLGLKKKTGSDEDKLKKRKHAPAEMKSNRPVPVLRDVGIAKTSQNIDPRFSSATGKLDEYKFYKDYEFLDDIQKDEIKRLEKVLRKVKSADKKLELQKEIGKKKQILTEKQRNLQIKERMHNMFTEEHKKVKNGKMPFFLKKSEIKKVAMEEKFKDLKQSGKLGKYMEKKRKRNSNKDHVSLPSSRRFKGDNDE